MEVTTLASGSKTEKRRATKPILSPRQQAMTKARIHKSNVFAAIFLPIITLFWILEIALGIRFYDKGQTDSYNVLVLTYNYATLAFVVVWLVALALCFKEDEIKSKHYEFILFFIPFSICCPLARIMFIQAPISPGFEQAWPYKFHYGIYLYFQCYSHQCTLIGALVLRQRIFYGIVKNNKKPAVLTSALIIYILCFSIPIPMLVCTYNSICDPRLNYSVYFSLMLILAFVFAFYLYYTIPYRNICGEFWQNLRAFVLHNCITVVYFSILISEYMDLPKYAVLEQLTSPFFVWLVILDSFGIPLTKVLSRKYLKNEIFKDLDVCGASYYIWSEEVGKFVLRSGQTEFERNLSASNVLELQKSFVDVGKSRVNCNNNGLGSNQTLSKTMKKVNDESDQSNKELFQII